MTSKFFANFASNNKLLPATIWPQIGANFLPILPTTTNFCQQQIDQQMVTNWPATDHKLTKRVTNRHIVQYFPYNLKRISAASRTVLFHHFYKKNRLNLNRKCQKGKWESTSRITSNRKISPPSRRRSTDRAWSFCGTSSPPRPKGGLPLRRTLRLRGGERVLTAKGEPRWDPLCYTRQPPLARDERGVPQRDNLYGNFRRLSPEEGLIQSQRPVQGPRELGRPVPDGKPHKQRWSLPKNAKWT